MDLESTLSELAPKLLRYCLGRGGDRATAEEVAQEALTALVQRWRSRGAPESPAAFAFTIARRRLYRAALRQRLLAPLESLADGHSTRPDPEQRAMQRSELQQGAPSRSWPGRSSTCIPTFRGK